jgi:hypothetical protein
MVVIFVEIVVVTVVVVKLARNRLLTLGIGAMHELCALVLMQVEDVDMIPQQHAWKKSDKTI